MNFMKDKGAEKKKSENKKRKKFWGVFALVMLILTGGVFAFPLNNDNIINNPFQGNINVAPENYPDFMNFESLEGIEDFDSIKEVSRKITSNFQEGKKLLNEDTLEKAVKSGDYETWKEDLKSMEGFPDEIEVIPREEFEILSQLRNLGQTEE